MVSASASFLFCLNVFFQERMGYKEGEGLGKIAEDTKQGYTIKDEMSKAQNSASQSESTYSDFAQRQMVLLYLHVLPFIHSS